MSSESVGDRIREFAKQRFGSQDGMARALSMPAVQLSKYINGTTKPGTDVLIRFTELGMSIDWLLTGTGEMMATPPPSVVDQLQIIVDKLRAFERNRPKTFMEISAPIGDDPIINDPVIRPEPEKEHQSTDDTWQRPPR